MRKARHYHRNPDGTRGPETEPCPEIGTVIFEDGKVWDEHGFDVYELREQVQKLSQALDVALRDRDEEA